MRARLDTLAVRVAGPGARGVLGGGIVRLSDRFKPKDAPAMIMAKFPAAR